MGRRSHPKKRYSKRRKPSRHGMAGRAKGLFRERLVAQALQLLKDWKCIGSFEMSRQNDLDDRRGIDATFTTLDGRRVDFQIKGSYLGILKHQKKHPDVPCVDVRGRPYAPDVAVLIQQQFNLPARPPDAGTDA